MRMKTGTLVSAAVVSVFGIAASRAHADLKLEQTVTMSGQAPGSASETKQKPQKTTQYYKGDKQRTDSGDTVTIFDAATAKYTIWNTKDKTYYEATTADLVAAGGAMPMGDAIAFSGEATVTDAKEDKKVAGKTAHHYTYAMTLKMTMKDPNAPAALAAFLPAFAITGEQWTVDVPGASTSASRLPSSALTQRLPAAMVEGLKPLMEKMASIKGVPVEQTQSFKIVVREDAPPELKQQATEKPMVMQTKTTTLSEDTISDTLFMVPPDYKKIETPKAPTPSA